MEHKAIYEQLYMYSREYNYKTISRDLGVIVIKEIWCGRLLTNLSEMTRHAIEKSSRVAGQSFAAAPITNPR